MAYGYRRGYKRGYPSRRRYGGRKTYARKTYKRPYKAVARRAISRYRFRQMRKPPMKKADVCTMNWTGTHRMDIGTGAIINTYITANWPGRPDAKGVTRSPTLSAAGYMDFINRYDEFTVIGAKLVVRPMALAAANASVWWIDKVDDDSLIIPTPQYTNYDDLKSRHSGQVRQWGPGETTWGSKILPGSKPLISTYAPERDLKKDRWDDSLVWKKHDANAAVPNTDSMFWRVAGMAMTITQDPGVLEIEFDVSYTVAGRMVEGLQNPRTTITFA